MGEMIVPPQRISFLRRSLRTIMQWLKEIRRNAGHSGTDNIVGQTLRHGRRTRGGRVA